MPIKPNKKHRPWLSPTIDKKPFQRITPNTDFYNSRAWRKVSRLFLQSNPFCQCSSCKNQTIPLQSNLTDHIKPINQGGDLWDESNFQAMNSRCHNRKSAKESHK